MGAIFKGIGKGLLNIVLIPAFLVGLAFSAFAGIGVFVLELAKQLGRFFTGKPLSCDLPEDAKAKEMIAAAQKQREEQLTGKSDVEIVQAEIADPIASYRDFAREAAKARAIESKEDVDFMLDDVTIEIDISVDRRNQRFNREIPQQPQPQPVPTESNEQTTAVERYEPKGSKF